jgi:DNA-binding beta-propeller fold protein YncE
MESNSTAGNVVVGYRWRGGALTRIGEWPTGGLGVDGAERFPNAVAVSGHRLYAVDAGSSDLAVFRIQRGGTLSLIERVDTLGTRPVGVAVRRDDVAVLDTQDSGPCLHQTPCVPVATDSVSLFRRQRDHLVARGNRSLSGYGGTAIAWDGRSGQLVVSQPPVDQLQLVKIRWHAIASISVFTGTGSGPCAMSIDDRGHLAVVNRGDGTPGVATVSTYSIQIDDLFTISAPWRIPATDPCSVAMVPGGRRIYVPSADSSGGAALGLLWRGQLTQPPPIDLSALASTPAVAIDGSLLASFIDDSHEVALWGIRSDGGLLRLGSAPGWAGLTGLVLTTG